MPSCTVRGGARRWCRSARIRMKFGSVKPVTGFPHCGWFSTFCDSTRNSTRARDRSGSSGTATRRGCSSTAPRKAFRPVLPQALPGCENTDGSYHCSFGTGLAEARLGIASDVDRLRAALLLQQAVVAADRERPARHAGPDAADLPVLDHLCQQDSSCPGRTAARRRTPSAACADGRSRPARSCGACCDGWFQVSDRSTRRRPSRSAPC